MSVRLRDTVAGAAPYRQGRPAPPGGFKLSSNELPVPPIDAVRDAVAAQADGINRYPNGAAPELGQQLAAHLGVESDRIMFGAGSVMVLDSLVLAVAGAGDEILYAWRSFEAYPTLALRSGATAVEVPNTVDHRHDLTAMVAAITDRTRVIIVCSPNNPTGTLVTQSEWDGFIAQVPSDVLVILDEAYIEFTTDPEAIDGIRAQRDHDNVVTVRTFSKAWGLAGLRLGYVVGNPQIVSAARTVSVPLAVGAAAQAAGAIALADADQVLSSAHAIAGRRDEWWQAAGGVESEIPRPYGNFLWLPTAGLDADAIGQILHDHGLVARQFPDGIRISVGEAEAAQPVMAAVAAIRGLA